MWDHLIKGHGRKIMELYLNVSDTVAGHLLREGDCGRRMQAVTHSQSASGRRIAMKKALPGKGKSGSSLEPIRSKSAIDLGRNISSSQSESASLPPPLPLPALGAAVPDWPSLPSQREGSEERPSTRAGQCRKRRKLTPGSSPPTMSGVVAWEAPSVNSAAVSSVSSQMTSLGPVQCCLPSAAACLVVQLAVEVSTLEARPVPSVWTSPLVRLSPVSTTVAVADEAIVVELKGIVGHLCSANW